MAEEITATPEQVPATGTPSEVTIKPEPPTQEHMIPKARFDEINDRLKALVEEQDKAQKASAKADEERMIEQNKFKELYEQTLAQVNTLKPVEEKYNTYLESAKTANATRIEGLPDEIKAIVPAYDNPLELSAWLDKSLPLIDSTKPKTPNLNAGAGGNGKAAKGVDSELLRRRFGI
ncbi:MAG: hypothetical protein GY938_16580 [Ketobacter sp.]|nr:hypothetical protein [Ketobacter sp.]